MEVSSRDLGPNMARRSSLMPRSGILIELGESQIQNNPKIAARYFDNAIDTFQRLGSRDKITRALEGRRDAFWSNFERAYGTFDLIEHLRIGIDYIRMLRVEERLRRLGEEDAQNSAAPRADNILR